MDLSHDKELMEQICMALLKTPASRSYDDLLLLKSYITKTELITKDLAGVVSPRQMNDICRSLGMETYQSGENVFNQGDLGDKVYIVLDGSCEVKVRYKIDLLQGQSEIREKHIVTYGSGQFFGERALQFDEPRSATVTCLELSHFVTIQKSIYLSVLAEARRDVSLNLKAEQFGTKEGVIKILSKVREKRTTQELDGVASYLYRRIPFFQKFTMQQLIELCRVAETVTIWGRSILFKQGQTGQAFYVILTGTVEVWVNDANHPSLMQHGRAGKSHDLTEGLGAKVNQLVTGDVFGERALENESSQRMASIITGEDTTELLVIAKEDYHNLVYVMMHSDSMHKLQLLRRTDIFHTLDVVHLRALARFMEPRKYQIDEEIVTAGKRSTEMIIIETGECRVITEVNEGLEHLSKEELRKLKELHYMNDTHHPTAHTNTASTSSAAHVTTKTHHKLHPEQETTSFSTEHNHKLHSKKKDHNHSHNSSIVDNSVSVTKRPFSNDNEHVLATAQKEMKKNILHSRVPLNTAESSDEDEKPAPPPSLSALRSKMTRFNSCDLIPVAKKKRVDLGRIAPNSVIAPYIASCETIHVEIFHPETVVASTLVTAYTIGKHDFFNHMPKDSRAALVKIVKEFKAPVLNPLWENTPKVLNDQQYKLEKAWDRFRSDIAHHPGKEVNILDSLKHISRYHISVNSGNDPKQKLKRIDISGFHGVGAKHVEVTMDWGKTPTAQTVAVVAAKDALDKRNVAMTTAAQSSLKDLIGSASMTNLIRTRLNHAHANDAISQGLLSAAATTTNSNTLTSVTQESGGMMGTRSLGNMFTGDDVQDQKMQNKITEYPFVLIQVHREYSRANPIGAVDPSRRLLKSYVRICGSFPSCAKAKEMADTQMEQLYLSMFQSKPENQEELVLSWNTFKSFPAMPVNDADHFMIYCRSTPMEFASINPSKNIFHVAYPAICKIQNQRYAVVMVNPLLTRDDNNMFVATKKKGNPGTNKPGGKSVSMGGVDGDDDLAHDIHNSLHSDDDEDDEDNNGSSIHKGKGSKRKVKAGQAGGLKKLNSNLSGNNNNNVSTNKLRASYGSIDVDAEAVDLSATASSIGGKKVAPWPIYLQELAVIHESIIISSTRLESLRYAIRRFGAMPNQSLLQHSSSTASTSSAFNTFTNSKTGEQIIEVQKSPTESSLSPLESNIKLKPFEDANKNDRILKLAHFEGKKICVIPLFKWVLVNDDTLDTLNFLYAFKESNIRKILMAEEFDAHRLEVDTDEDGNQQLVPSRRVGEYRDVMTSLEERNMSADLIKSFSEAGFVPHSNNPLPPLKSNLASSASTSALNTYKAQGVVFINNPETSSEMEHLMDQARALQILEKDMESKEISKQINEMQSAGNTGYSSMFLDHGVYTNELHKATFATTNQSQGFSEYNFSSNTSKPANGSIQLESRLQALNSTIMETTKLLDTSNQLCSLEHVNATPPKDKQQLQPPAATTTGQFLFDEDEESVTESVGKKKPKTGMMSPKLVPGKITNDRLRNLHRDDKMGIMKERLHVIESLQNVRVNNNNGSTNGTLNASATNSTLRSMNNTQGSSYSATNNGAMGTSQSAASFFGIGRASSSQASSSNLITPAGKKLAESLRVLSDSLDAQYKR